MNVGVRFHGIADIVALPHSCWREMDRLSYGADPDTQAALNRLLQRRGHICHRVRSRNLTTTAGLNYAVPALLPNGSWFIGVKDTGTPQASDTISSHATWSELTAYTQTARPALTLGAASGGVANNNANVALFTAPTGGMTFTGWFLINNATKGNTTTGTLISVANHASPQVLAAGVVLRQTLVATVT